MPVGHFITERLIGKIFVAWLAAVALATIGAIYTSFSIVEIAGVIGMLGTLGILAIQAHEVSTKRGTIKGDEKSEKRASTSESSENQCSEDSSSGQKVGPTEGLSATERRVQNELIRESYRQFAEGPLTFWPSPQGDYLRNHLQNEFEDVDERARTLAERAEELGVTTGVHPAGFAAACLYKAGHEQGQWMTQTKAADVANTSTATVRTHRDTLEEQVV